MSSFTSNSGSDEICPFYNSFYQDGCRNGRYCRFTHLTAYQYAKYSIEMKNQNPLSMDAKQTREWCRQLVYAKKFGKCVKSLEMLVDDYPFDDVSLSLLAHCYCMLQRPEANLCYRRLIAVSPDNGMHHMDYGVFLYRHQQPANDMAAKECFVTALDLCQRFKSSLTRKMASKIHGYAANFWWSRLGDLQNATKLYEASLDILETPKCLWHYGMLLRDIGHSDEAERYLERAIAIEHGVPTVSCHLDYIDLLKHKGKFDKAEHHLLVALKLDPNESRFLFAYGELLCESMHKMDLGLNYLHRAVRAPLYPNLKYVEAYQYYKKQYENQQHTKRIEPKTRDRSYRTRTLRRQEVIGFDADLTTPCTAKEVFITFLFNL